MIMSKKKKSQKNFWKVLFAIVCQNLRFFHDRSTKFHFFLNLKFAFLRNLLMTFTYFPDPSMKLAPVARFIDKIRLFFAQSFIENRIFPRFFNEKRIFQRFFDKICIFSAILWRILHFFFDFSLNLRFFCVFFGEICALPHHFIRKSAFFLQFFFKIEWQDFVFFPRFFEKNCFLFITIFRQNYFIVPCWNLPSIFHWIFKWNFSFLHDSLWN